MANLNFLTRSASIDTLQTFDTLEAPAQAVVVDFGGGTLSGTTLEAAGFTAGEQTEILAALSAMFQGLLVTSTPASLPAGTPYATVYVGSAADALPGVAADNAGFVFTTAGTTVSSVIDLIANEVTGLTDVPAATQTAGSGNVSLLRAAIDQNNAAFVNPNWSAGNTPATYFDPFTLETITLTWNVNAFSSVNNAVTGMPTAEAIYITGGDLTSVSEAYGIPVFVNDGYTVALFGGGSASTVSGTSIVFNGGTSNGLYGGGRGAAVINGDISLSVKGGVVSTLSGCSNVSPNTVNGNINIDVAGGTINLIYGSYNDNITGNVAHTISQGLFTGTAYLGGQAGSEIGGNVIISISGGIFRGNVYCGASHTTTHSAVGSVDKDVNVTITGGFIETFYGGGIASTDATRAATVKGGVTVNFTGGTIGAFFGGGAARAIIANDVNVTVSGTALVTGNMYLGGNTAGVNGNVFLSIGGNALIRGNIYAGSNSNTYAVGKDASVTLSGGTVTGSLDLATNVNGSSKTVLVNGNARIGNLTGATNITVQSGASLFCDFGLTNSDKLLIFATGGWSVDVDGVFANMGTITVDATGYEMGAGVYQLKLIETNTWSGNRDQIELKNYSGSRNLGFRIIGDTLYLVDVSGFAYVNSGWTDEFTTPLEYEDPYTKDKATLDYGRNAFESVAASLAAQPPPQTIYVTGGTFTTNPVYANGVNLVVNDGEVTSLFGGTLGDMELKTGKSIELTVNGGSIGALYGGCNGNLTRQSADDYDQVNVRVKGGFVGMVYGGGIGNVAAWTNVYITGGTLGTVFGGSISGSSKETYVSITGGVIGAPGGTTGVVYGGGQSGNVTENSYIDIGAQGGTVAAPIINGNVYAGGLSGTVAGDAIILFYGGTINGNLDAATGINGTLKRLRISKASPTTPSSTTVVNGTITGLTELLFESDSAYLIVNRSWSNTGTTSMTAVNATLLIVNATYTNGSSTDPNAGAITVDASGYEMGSSQLYNMVQLIKATSFKNYGAYTFEDGETYYDGIDGKRYGLVTANTGLFIVEQGHTAFVASNWTVGDDPLVYNDTDGRGYYDANAFSAINEATNGLFTKIYIEGGSYTDVSEFRGIEAVIQSGIRIAQATNFTANVFGGAASGTLAAATNLTVNGGNFGKKNLVGGNLISVADSLTKADCTLTINGGSNFGSIVGGNQISAGVSLTGQNTLDIKLTATATAVAIFGGNQIAAGTSSVTLTGGCTTTVSGGIYSNFITGADYITAGDVTRTGDVSLSISGGSFANIVSGGLNFRSTDVNQNGALTGDVSLNISGGTFSKYIYAGNMAPNAATAPRTQLIGNTELVLDASVNNIKIDSNQVFAGSYGAGTVTGNTSVTIKGYGSKLTFDGGLSGASQSAFFTGDKSDIANYTFYVGGTKSLSFEGFTGDFNAALVCFNSVSFYNNSDVKLTAQGSYLAIASNWSFEYGSSAQMDAGTNNFTGDTLNFDLLSWDGSNSWEVFSGSSAVLTGWNDASTKVYFGNEQATWNAAETAWMTGVDHGYKLALEGQSLVLGAWIA